MHDIVEGLFDEFTYQKLDEFCNSLLLSYSKLEGSWHPLGFAIVKLFETGSYKYRLHFWPKNERKPKEPDWQIHNHIFDLESLVICGKIGSKEFIVQEDTECNTSHLEYEVIYHKQGSSIVTTDRLLKVSLDNEKWTSVGASYQVECGVFHQTYVKMDEFAASLVRTSNEKIQSSPIVVGDSGANRVFNCPQKKLSKAHLVELITSIHC
jgi:hypothetical protein